MRRHVPTNDFLIFNQELATLLKAGLPLVQSLDILRRRVPNPIFRTALDDIHERVRSGSALSEAFEAQGSLFTGVYTASLMAGEKSGSLEQVLRRYVQHVKVLAARAAHVISALIYPVILMLLSLGVVGLIVFKVVPEFADFYRDVGHDAKLPLSTRILVAVSTALIDQRRPAGARRDRARRCRACGSGSRASGGGSTGGCCGCRLSGPPRAPFATAQVSRTSRRCSRAASRS